MIIGVSGKSGSGKSIVSKYIADNLNYKWIDVDEYSKNIRKEYKEEIIELINNKDILNGNGEIDSKLLGSILFEDKTLMEKYNLFVYKKLKSIVKELIEKHTNVVIDTIFLPIMDVFSVCDYKILVICDEETRKERLTIRDNVSLDYIKKRDSNGLNYDEEGFDLVVDNNKDYKSIIDKFIDKIKS